MEGACARKVVGEEDFFHVLLVGDDGSEWREGMGVGGGDSDGGQRQADAKILGLADRRGGRAHVSHAVHHRHVGGVVGEVLRGRPIGEVDTLFAREAAVDGFGGQRKQWRGDLTQRGEHGPQHVEGALIVVPEALTRPTDMPVRKCVEERSDRRACTEQIEGIHLHAYFCHEHMELAKNVFIKRIVRLRFSLCRMCTGIRVQREE